MPLYASTFQWPAPVVSFVSLSHGARDGDAELVATGDRWILKAPGHFSAVSGQPDERILSATLNSEPTLIRGSVFVIDSDLGLRVDELRVGSVELDAEYVSATAHFEHLASACTYRHEDGAARDAHEALVFPALDDGPGMRAELPCGATAITLSADEPVPLEAFEAQLASFQDLLTFSADLPCGRTSLIMTDSSGTEVRVVGRDKYKPFNGKTRKPIEFSLRFASDQTQGVIDGWWKARDELLPVTQIIAGLRYQPGYVEADVILGAAAIEALATAALGASRPPLSVEEAEPIIVALDSLSGMNQAQSEAIAHLKGDLRRTTFRSKVQSLIEGVAPEMWRSSRVEVDEWIKLFLRARNGIAHAAPGLSGGASIWKESELLRSIRDANWIVITLVLLTQLGVPDAAIGRAAERLGTRYGVRHSGTPIFT
ncbi:hypothetical protein [Propionibacterium sp.]|uniref:hypothetical protein n=1 Tax=Propionibacterium sp. TaxID=1977903 RepID=UPI0039E78077